MKKVIDIHIHMGGPGDSGSGCRMSNEFLFSPAMAMMLLTLRASPFDLRDEKIKETILATIEGSARIDLAVLLALDGVYRNARYIESESHLVVPNDYIFHIARRHPRVLFGASVHPYRKKKDMLEETKRCIDQGAVLFKWIPSSQQIDPKEDRCLPFYEILAKEGVPLLCHTGAELAVPTSRFEANTYNDPRRLKRALAVGVKVIAAHCASPYLGGGLPSDKDYFEELVEMLKVSQRKGWDLYADLSAFCTPTRLSFLKRIKQKIDTGEIDPDRFLYGSDFPIPIIDINLYKEPLDVQGLLCHVKNQGNPLDHYYDILKKFGIPDSIFTRAPEILRIP